MSFRMCVDAAPQHTVYQHHPRQVSATKLPVPESAVAVVVNAESAQAVEVPTPSVIEDNHAPEDAPVVLKIHRNKRPDGQKK